MRRVVHERVVQGRQYEANRCAKQMKCDDQVVPRGRLGVVPWERFIDKGLAYKYKDAGKQMGVYIGSLVVQIGPAFETPLGVVHDGPIALADAVVVLIPWRDIVV